MTALYAIRCGGINLAYSPVSVYGLNALSQEYVVFGNTLMVNLNQIGNAFANAMAASLQALGQKHGIAHQLSMPASVLQGFHWSFWSIEVLNIIAFALLFKLKNRSAVELK